MKEKIYTIPINDAFSEISECPVCRFLQKEEADRAEYTLGDSMMQPDERIVSNQKGYCRRHTEMLLAGANKLSFALILESRLGYVYDSLSELKTSQVKHKKLPVGKGRNNGVKKLAEQFDDTISGCVVCDWLETVMQAFTDNLFYMYKNDEHFREKFFSSKGFCVHHFKLLLEKSADFLDVSEAREFAEKLIELEMANIERMKEEVTWFTKKFDYRYKNEDWKNSRDAVERASEKTAMFMRDK